MKIVTDICLDDVYPLIDIKSLFVGRWQFKKTKGSEEAYQELLQKKAWPAFTEWKTKCKEEKIFEPKVSYGYFVVAELALLGLKNTAKQALQLQKTAPLQLVTVGSKVVEKCQWLFAAHKYVDYLYLHGLAAAMAEALAEFWHRQILKERGISFDVSKKLPIGSRISPGYPAWPTLSDQKEFCRLLDSSKIGVSVTENFQLVPEYSTSALILL